MDVGVRKSGHRSLLASIAVTVSVAGGVFVAARYAWNEWTLYALIVTALFFFGGVRFWPWGLPRARAAGVGVVLGLLVAVGEFLFMRVP